MPLFRKIRAAKRSSSSVQRFQRHCFRPMLESLEARLVPAPLVVSTTADSGPGSLRQAITTADSEGAGVTDTITFSVTGAIQLASPLPALASAVNIQGPGASSLTIEPAAGVSSNIFTVDSGVTANISGLTMANANESGITNAGTLNLDNCVITGNSVTGASGSSIALPPTNGTGGGIDNTGTLQLTHCTISNNTATGGTGVSSAGVFLAGAQGLGGGIYDNGGLVTIVDSTLSGNQAVGGASTGFDLTQAANGGKGLGGGLYATGSGINTGIVVHNSTFGNNQALGGAGGNGASSSPNGAVTAGNGGNGLGGGLYMDGTAGLGMTSGTIATNSSAGGPAGTGGPSGATPGKGMADGIDDASSADVQIDDTIVADNTATTSNPDLSGNVFSRGYNLVKNAAGWSGQSGSDLVGVDPDLGPLADNGGPTQTFALLPGSPAFNAGNPSYSATGPDATDQRGLPRIVDGRVDIGAYEVQNNGPATLVVTTTADSGPGSLRQAITEANFAAGATDTITFGVTGTIQLASALPTLTNAVNIDGPGSASLTIEPGPGVFASIFTINTGIAVNISGLTMTKGTGTGEGGFQNPFIVGGAVDNAGDLSLDHCVIVSNSITGQRGEFGGGFPGPAEGGGIYNAGTLMLTDCTVSNNQATGGDGGLSEAGGTGSGGGIYSNGGSVTIVDSTLSGNQAVGGGGAGRVGGFPGGEPGGMGMGAGLYVTNGAQVAIYNSTLSANQAIGGPGSPGEPAQPPEAPGNGGDGVAGGIYVASGSLTITSGTIAGNNAAGGPGGASGTSSTPNGNPGNGTVGGVDNAGGTVTIADTILANYAATSNPDVQGTIHTNGYNLVKQPKGGTFIGNATADIYGVDPRLGPLENNGGPTDTRALLAGSPAINAGDPNYSATGFDATDQRGFPRIVGGRVDIGAYEVQANEPPTGSSIAATSPSVVFAVTANGGLQVRQGSAWTAIGGDGTISSISAVTDAHGNATVFAVTANHGLAEWSQSSGWRVLGAPGTILLTTAGLDANGLADVYVLTGTNQLTAWSTSSGWLPAPVGASGTILSMSAANGSAVYVASTDHAVYEFSPQTGWVQLHSPGFANSVSAETNSSGQTTVFAVTAGNALYSFTPQTGWTQLGNFIQVISAGSGVSGQAEVYVLTTADDFAKYSTTSGWRVIGGAGTIAQFDATTSDYVFAVGTDQSIYSYSDQSGWMPLAGPGFGVS